MSETDQLLKAIERLKMGLAHAIAMMEAALDRDDYHDPAKLFDLDYYREIISNVERELQMNPDQHREEAHDMDARDQRKEWAPLHGDGQPRTFIESVMDKIITDVRALPELDIYRTDDLDLLRAEIQELRRRLLLKQGEIDYLEDKCKWLQNELDRERNAGWRKG